MKGINEIDLSRSVLIVAHPDDEILWFSSILDRIGEIIIIFRDYPPDPRLGQARQHVIDHYPFTNTRFLGLDEPASFNLANWPVPEVTDFGVRLQNEDAESRYRSAYDALFESLHQRFSASPAARVFTHNPWGEYGHEDHILVFSVIQALQASHPFELWVSSYVSNETHAFMKQRTHLLGKSVVCGKTNSSRYEQLKMFYQKYQCWTWQSPYKLPKREYFYKVDAANISQTDVVPRMIEIKTHYKSPAPAVSRQSWFGRLLRRLKLI